MATMFDPRVALPMMHAESSERKQGAPSLMPKTRKNNSGTFIINSYYY